MEKLPSREDDFDKEFAVSTFDYFIDQYQAGAMTYQEALQAYSEVMVDKLENQA